MGSHYFCDSGNSGNFTHSTIFLDIPLWDGKGCIFNSTCCQFNEPPVFYRVLAQSSENNLKMSIVLNAAPSEEDIYLTKMKLFIELLLNHLINCLDFILIFVFAFALHWKNIQISCTRSVKGKVTGRSPVSHMVVTFPNAREYLVSLYLSYNSTGQNFL